MLDGVTRDTSSVDVEAWSLLAILSLFDTHSSPVHAKINSHEERISEHTFLEGLVLMTQHHATHAPSKPHHCSSLPLACVWAAPCQAMSIGAS